MRRKKPLHKIFTKLLETGNPIFLMFADSSTDTKNIQKKKFFKNLTHHPSDSVRADTVIFCHGRRKKTLEINGMAYIHTYNIQQHATY